MTDRIEKAYCLKEEEIAVLLSLKGVRQLLGFQMGGSTDMNREELCRILFGMAKQNILSVSGNQIQMEEDVDVLLKDMAEAESVLFLTGGEEYPECCIYAGKNLIFVCPLGQNGKIYRLESVARQKAWQKMRECGWAVPGVLKKPQIDQKDEEEFHKIQELAKTLYSQKKETILQREEVKCCLMQYAVPKVRKTRQLLIVSDVLDDYLIWSDEEQNSVYLYSDEKSQELFGQLIGGGL